MATIEPAPSPRNEAGINGYTTDGFFDEMFAGADAHASGPTTGHAWTEIYLPVHGWCGLDPTNNRVVDGHYVKISVGRDYADVSPLRGTYRGTPNRKMAVDVLVTTEAPAAVA